MPLTRTRTRTRTRNPAPTPPSSNPRSQPDTEQAPIAREGEQARSDGEQVLTREVERVERVATQAAALRRGSSFHAQLEGSAPVIPIGAALGEPVTLNTPPATSVPSPTGAVSAAKPRPFERSDTFYARGGRDPAPLPNPSP